MRSSYYFNTLLDENSANLPFLVDQRGVNFFTTHLLTNRPFLFVFVFETDNINILGLAIFNRFKI